jgi:hypothetical protein
MLTNEIENITFLLGVFFCTLDDEAISAESNKLFAIRKAQSKIIELTEDLKFIETIQ